MLSALALAFGLAMDATAVSAARGLTSHRRRELVILPAVFGGFQAAMAAAGWAAGARLGPYIAGWDAWVAFALLVVIGGKMVLDGWRGNDDDGPGHASATVAVYLGLGVATSIDAAAAGLTLPLVPVAPWLALTLIGGVTAGCSALGFLLGRYVGERFGAKLTILGGLVLIGIGVEIVVRGG